jgi:hypothetical protein
MKFSSIRIETGELESESIKCKRARSAQELSKALIRQGWPPRLKKLPELLEVQSKESS